MGAQPTDLPAYQLNGGILAWLLVDESFAHVGSTPAVHNASVFVGAIFLLFAVVIDNLRDKPWYEQKVVNSGFGPFEGSLR